MPKEWTDKQEREYQHIVDSEKDQGRSPNGRRKSRPVRSTRSGRRRARPNGIA